MLPDFGPHLLVVAIVALVVVGPKDLPMLLRRLGQFMAKMRGLAAEFRASFDEMARQSELDELRREVEAMREARYAAPLPSAEVHDPAVQNVFDEIDRRLGGAEIQFSPPMSSQIAEATPVVEAPVQPPAAEAAPAKPAAKRKAPVKAAAKAVPADKPAARKSSNGKAPAKASAKPAAAKTAPAKATSKPARRKAAAPDTAS